MMVTSDPMTGTMTAGSEKNSIAKGAKRCSEKSAWLSAKKIHTYKD
jgi:hypothetical protein